MGYSGEFRVIIATNGQKRDCYKCGFPQPREVGNPLTPITKLNDTQPRLLVGGKKQMRLKKYLLRMIVLVLACLLGFAVVFACACLYQLTDRETPLQNSLSAEPMAINREVV